MSNRTEVLTAVHALNVSMRELEQAALYNETQTDILIGQGRTTNTTLAELVKAVGELTARLGHYLEDADVQGGRIAKLEREVRGLVTDGR
jgi:hypothetical protein